MVVADGWMELVPPVRELTEEEIVEYAKEARIQELHKYDESSEVNSCIIVYNGEEISYWADKHERDALKSALRDCITMGRSDYRLDLRDRQISIFVPCETLLYMMAVLEVYAVDCFNRTTDHEYVLRSLSTQDEIWEYEFRGNGYPEKPVFNL